MRVAAVLAVIIGFIYAPAGALQIVTLWLYRIHAPKEAAPGAGNDWLMLPVESRLVKG